VQVAGGEVVGLVEHHEQPHGVGRDPFQECTLGRRDRRVGRGDQHGRVQAGQVGVGRAGVVLEHRPDPGGVDQPHPGIQQRRMQPGGHLGHPQAVARVGLLADEAGHPVQQVRFLAAVEVGDHQALLAALEHGRDGGERQDADRQDLPAKQRVDEARLATLELADHCDLEPQGLQPAGCLRGQVGDLGHADESRRLGQGRQHPLQHRSNRAGGLDTHLHLHLPIPRRRLQGRSHQPEGGHSELHRWVEPPTTLAPC
jgi:hypothetical protein